MIKQTKGLELISGLTFALGICWMRCKELLSSIKQTLIRRKNQNNPIMSEAKKKKKDYTWPNQLFRAFFKKKTSTDGSIHEENSPATVQTKDTLQEIGACASKSPIKRRLHHRKYRELPTREKTSVSLKNSKTINILILTSLLLLR